ncbi:MAG: GerMN domain-containing protein [Actinomycetales bacterium]|nr:GerMN domain-containing protein [Actinomycetales bacterium]
MSDDRRGTRRAPAGIAAALAATALLGCTFVPTSGPVVEGRTVVTGGSGSVVRVIARPPTPGATPEDIVRGFLAASASSEDDFAVARSFLTPQAAERWRPTSGIRVYDTPVLSADSSLVRLAAALIATVDPAGHLTIAPTDAAIEASFGLVRSTGEWRIADPPTGLLLTRGDLARGYRTLPAWYLGVGDDVLVPTGVTIPITAAGGATVLARSLLAGPPQWLAPAVRTAIPEGTRLSIDAVPIIESTAQVDLDRGVLGIDPASRRLLAGQLVTTLTGLPGVTAVRVSVAGQPLLVPGASEPFTAADFADLLPDPGAPTSLVASLNGQIVTTAGDPAVSPRPVTPARLARRLPLTSPAVDFTRGRWAAKVAGRPAVALGSTGSASGLPGPGRGAEVVIALPGGGVRGPVLGPDGRFWLTGGGAVYTVDERGLAEVALAPAATEVLAVAPSPDGARVALIVRGPSGDVLRLAALSTTAAPEVQSLLTGVRPIARDPLRVASVAWRDATSLVVIAGTVGPTEVPTMAVVNVLDGSVRSLPGLIGARSITAAAGHPVIAASGEEAQPILQRLSENRWQVISQGSAPAYAPGTP